MITTSIAITPSELLPLLREADEFQLYRPSEVALLAGTTEGNLAQMRYRGTGPRVTMQNTSVRYMRRDLKAWMESQNYDPAGGVPKHIKRRKAGPGRPVGKKRHARKGA